MLLLPAASLHFYLLFPRPKQFFQRRPAGTLTAVYGPPLLFLTALVVMYFRARWLRGDASHGSTSLSLRYIIRETQPDD